MFRLDRFLTLYFFQPLLKRNRLQTEAVIPILMYHSISDDPEPGISSYYRITTSPKRFREHMVWLYERGYSVIGLDEALRQFEIKKTNLNHHVVLTFDDGYYDFLNQAWPILENFGYTATVFLPTAFIGEDRLQFKRRHCMTWSEARELINCRISFGSHTVSHPKLYRLPWDEICRELRDSRLQIEDKLQTPVPFFSYPFAFPQEDRSYRRCFRQKLIDQGYLLSVTTIIGRARLNDDLLCLMRLPINNGDDEKFFQAKLLGNYDWMAKAQFFFRKIKRLTS